MSNNISGKTVMVTGSKGEIAQQLITKLKQNEIYEKIYCVNRQVGWLGSSPKHKEIDIYADLTNEAWVESVLKSTQPNTVYHLAVKKGDTFKAYQDNVVMVINLLKFTPKETKIIYLSDVLAGKDISVDNLYYASKIACENLLRISRPDSMIIKQPQDLYV